MQPSSRVTVLMPVFNAEKYVSEAITSILNQTSRDFVFLIINDGSTDRSEEIILSYKDPRIKYCRNDRNRGVIYTLNHGLQESNTEYIARMDADDIALPDRLRTQINFMHKNPAVGVLGGFTELLHASHERWKVPLKHDDIVATLPFYNPFSHPTVIMRTRVLKENGLLFSKEYIHMEDYELWYRMRNITGFANLNKILLRYRYSGQNISFREHAAKEKVLLKFYRVVFHDMGLSCANGEEELQADLQYKRIRAPEREYLEKIRNWILVLYESNGKSHFFPHAGFNNNLLKLWKRLFYHIIFDIKSMELAEHFITLSRELPFSGLKFIAMKMIYAKQKIIPGRIKS